MIGHLDDVNSGGGIDERDIAICFPGVDGHDCGEINSGTGLVERASQQVETGGGLFNTDDELQPSQTARTQGWQGARGWTDEDGEAGNIIYYNDRSLLDDDYSHRWAAAITHTANQ